MAMQTLDQIFSGGSKPSLDDIFSGKPPAPISIAQMIAPSIVKQSQNDQNQTPIQKGIGYAGAAINDASSLPFRGLQALGDLRIGNEDEAKKDMAKTTGGSFAENVFRAAPLALVGGPEELIGKGVLGSGIMNAGLKMLPASAAIALHSESQKQNPTVGGVLGKTALGVGLGAGTQALGEGLSAAGTKIAQSAIKPSQKLLNAKGSQFDIENLLGSDVKPLDIPGAPKSLVSKQGQGKTLDNLQQYNDALNSQKNQIISNSPAQTNASEAIDDASHELKMALSAGKYRDMKPQIEKALAYWKSDAASLGDILDGPSTVNYRQSLGNAARFDATNNSATPGDRLVASEIYSQLNRKIADQIPELRPIDAEFSKIIPLQNAISTSIGRTQNNYPIGIREATILAATHGISPSVLIPALGKAAIIKGSSSMGAGVASRQAGDAIQGISAKPLLPVMSGVLGNQ